MKFNFPGIMLPDTSHHDSCTGSFIYTINTQNTMPLASTIDHRVSIYFDYNDPVMTNTASTTICLPTGIPDKHTPHDVVISPNPAANELYIRYAGDYYSYTIINSLGQLLACGSIKGAETKLDIQQLSAGLYYICIKGDKGVQTKKFVKL
jgi:hypothetical protein